MNSLQDLSRFSLPPNFRGRPSWFVQLWWIVQSTLFSLSPQFLYGWRRWLLSSFGAKIGRNVLIRPSARITFPWKLTIGENSWIGDEVVLYSLGDIIIGSNAVISQRSYICTGGHDYNSPGFDIYARTVTIEDQVWIATDVFVSPGVTIGRGAVVGARSTVFCDMPPSMICYGSPAKPIRTRTKT